jgi:hypothetical protein
MNVLPVVVDLFGYAEEKAERPFNTYDSFKGFRYQTVNGRISEDSKWSGFDCIGDQEDL